MILLLLLHILLVLLAAVGFFYLTAVFLNMVIAYPLQSQNDYTELLFSLRSVEKYFIGDYEVVVIGDKIPYWLTGVTQICIPDIMGRKQLTIKYKTYAAIEYAKGKPILQMNDDVYLLKETDGYTYPQYYHKNLDTVGESGSKPLMAQLMVMKKPVKNFDLHQPIVYDGRFKEIFSHFPADVIVKSCYSNYLCLDGEVYLDYKINKKTDRENIENTIHGKNYFSTGPIGLPFAIPVLQKLFPEKSKFEV